MKSGPSQESKIVYLVRHGESLPRDNMSHQDGWNVGLNLWGKREAQAAAAWLKKKSVRQVYTSPLARTKETADRIAAPLGLSSETKAAFAEWAPHPEWKGKQFKEAKRQARADVQWAPPLGESVRASAERFARGLEEISQTGLFPVVVVSHALVMQNFLMILTKSSYPPILPEGSITTLFFGDAGWQVIDVGHQPSFFLRTVNALRKWGKVKGVWS